jgi:prepilin-type N-terminal cleavage/methylation domain-containing protein
MSRRAFTLIELLVVIAIIAILAAILFPVFASARERATQTACLSNMKQIGTAVYAYLQDWDECYPMSRFPTGGKVYGRDDLQPSDYIWKNAVNSYINNVEVFKCPSNQNRNFTDADLQRIDPNPRRKLEGGFPISYVYNGSFFNEYAHGAIGPVRSSRIKDASALLFIFETRETYPDLGAWCLGWPLWSEPNNQVKGAFNSHRGRVNAIFADTHARSIKLADTCINDYWKASDPNYSPERLRTHWINQIRPEYR